MSFDLNFPYAYGEPSARADFRSQSADFIVDEILGFEPMGSGEHFYLHIRKTDTNTEWLAKQIAEHCQVKKLDVGFCGLKDRNAITSQWFSVYAPKTEAFEWQGLIDRCGQKIELLAASKHNKKLKRGQHAGNRFEIVLRNLEGEISELQARLERIQEFGVPNYFGEQRFGNNGNNLHSAQALFGERARLPKDQKSFAISAARSYLFNGILAARVGQGTWQQALPGDVLEEGIITAPLWGRGRSATSDEALTIEQQVLEPFATWRDGLEHCGLQQERRKLVLLPQNLQFEFNEQSLRLSFDLPGGEFATAVLRELTHLINKAHR